MSNKACPCTVWCWLRRLAWLGFVAAGLAGCSLLPTGRPSPVPLEPVAPPTVSEPTQPEALPPSPLPSLTFTPTGTSTGTPLPASTSPATLTPFSIVTPFPSLTPYKLPTFATASMYSGGSSHCCTLRVRNEGKRAYWIGTHPPTLGNCIEPDEYIEFYLPDPGTVRVYWCRFYRQGLTVADLFNCLSRLVTLPEGVTELEVR